MRLVAFHRYMQWLLGVVRRVRLPRQVYRILGWSSIVLGVAGTILPIIPGLPFLILGTHMIGPRDRKLRWLRVHTKLILRSLSHSPFVWVRQPARMARRANAETMRYLRAWRRSSGNNLPSLNAPEA